MRKLTVVLLLAGVALPARADDVRLAIWRLKPLGLDAPTTERLEVLLRAEASRIRGFALQEAKQTEGLLGRADNAALLECGGETACLAKIGKALGVDKLITGVIGALGEDYTYDLKLINVAKVQEEIRINGELSGREDQLIPAIRAALYKLMAPDQLIGSVLVEVPVQGAEVLVDGKPAGVTPLDKPIGNLRPGSHRLEIRKPGLTAFQGDVPVRFQQTTRVKVDLDSSAVTGLSYESEGGDAGQVPPAALVVRKPAPGISGVQVAAWSTLGAGAAVAIVGGILGWRSKVNEDQVNEAVEMGTLDKSYENLIQRGKNLALGANISFGVAGGAGLAALVLFIVEWVGGGSEESGASGDTNNAKVEAAPGGAALRFTF